MKATVFLGGGRITSALVAGLRLAGYARPIVVHDRNARKLKDLKRDYGVETEADLRRAVNRARLLVIAVRPDSVGGLLRDIGTGTIHRQLAVVSLAAGVPLSKLRAYLGAPIKWVRAMPSPVSRSGRGLTALSFDRGFPSDSRAEVRELFSLVGAVVEVPEKQFDGFTVTFSSSNGYHALAALIQAAEKIGLDRKTARMAAAHALVDGIAAWREGKSSLEELLHEAATPGGTAAAVMYAMDRSGYQQTITRGLRAGMKQAARNARG
ncbi:MAG TPA: pyrroline-5-carboxylate reductase dimerization domain-containing protein [Candidatus Sulfotelmatobacter sp.]|nr:pyrroline-5-carboxylate reductase dimerization domain-containing protein [Candidatus Sulfotelmatobacter sp.]